MSSMVESVIGSSNISEVYWRNPGGPDIDRIVGRIKDQFIKEKTYDSHKNHARMTPEQAEAAWQQAVPFIIAHLEDNRDNPDYQEKFGLGSNQSANDRESRRREIEDQQRRAERDAGGQPPI